MKGFVLALLISVICLNASAQTKNFIDQPYLEVSGEADSLITPDEIYIKIQLSEKDTRDRVPIDELESKMILALKNIGINTETNLTTSDMISSYQHYFLKQKDIMKSKQFILKVNKASLMDSTFNELEKIGISNVRIDKVTHSNMKNIVLACKGKAIMDARNKATAMVNPLGQSIGSAIQISDNSSTYNNQLAGIATGIQIRGNSSYRSVDVPETYNVEFKKIKVAETVSVKFILK